jgi:hypothetical protein
MIVASQTGKSHAALKERKAACELSERRKAASKRMKRVPVTSVAGMQTQEIRYDDDPMYFAD